MNEDFVQRNIVPTTNYQRYKFQSINYRPKNNNGISSNTLNSTLNPINQNKPSLYSSDNLLIKQQNLESTNTGLARNRKTSGVIQNSNIFYNGTKPHYNCKNIKIKKGRILSSGTLIASKQSFHKFIL